MPIEKVGLYVPGGTAAYPSSVLMNCIPAKIAGCRQIVMVSPPTGGDISPVILAAARIAASLGAMKLILMTDVRGLLRDKDDESTLIPLVNVSDVSRLKKEGVISGGMIPKIDCCVDAVRRGVGRAHIIDGRTPHSILVELFTDEGIGTMFY